jgi:DNA-binding IclR family transcriptional regulator
VEAVRRTLDIIQAISREEETVGASSLARTLGLPKSVVFRTLSDLVEAGYLTRDESKGFVAGPAMVELCLRVLGTHDLRAISFGVMQELTVRTGETTTLNIRVGNRKTVYAQVESPSVVRYHGRVGEYDPLHVGSSGRAILSTLDDSALMAYLKDAVFERYTSHTLSDIDAVMASVVEARERGYTIGRGELDESSAGVSAPIYGPDGVAIASLCVAGPSSRLDDATLNAYGHEVVVAAQRISRLLNGTQAFAGQRPASAT